MHRIHISRGVAFDIALAAALCLVGLYEVLVAPLAEDIVEGPTWLNVLAVVAGSVPLAWRRRYPFWVSVAVYTVLAGRALLVAEPLELYSTTIAVLVATYTVASYAPLRDAVLAAAFSALAIAVAVVRGSGTDAAWDPLASAILLGSIWLVGRVVGVRNERARTLHDARDLHAAEAVAEERARIARELHDAVSHSLAAIALQSGGARNVLDHDPERARDSLAVIERTARQGLEEMRRMLGLLGGADDEEAALTPQPGIGRLDDLVEAVRAAGVDVRATVMGEVRPLPAAVDVSAYRLLQEALTNVMKHARATEASVLVRYRPEVLEIEVEDDGDGAGADGGTGGFGLVGMRERMQVLGGSVEAGPRQPGPGFRVAARVPL
ncbi:MAG TPA: histidine kinase [Nocardioides sp.]|uniref:sensor histidine kinase n=1 Tax=Nocardioides sp. TaxID=35761 RepID=UPI002D807D1D|nr:histidine kinase [Nocardioides sp.]HET6653044.1 histidine kinase [Nocardioides sp.]